MLIYTKSVLNELATDKLRDETRKLLRSVYGPGETVFTVNVYDWPKRFLGNFSSMKEAEEINPEVYFATHSPQGCYMNEWVLEYNMGPDKDHLDHNVILVIGDSKRDCYINFLLGYNND